MLTRTSRPADQPLRRTCAQPRDLAQPDEPDLLILLGVRHAEDWQAAIGHLLFHRGPSRFCLVRRAAHQKKTGRGQARPVIKLAYTSISFLLLDERVHRTVRAADGKRGLVVTRRCALGGSHRDRHHG
jgi:hypothetical protein